MFKYDFVEIRPNVFELRDKETNERVNVAKLIEDQYNSGNANKHKK